MRLKLGQSTMTLDVSASVVPENARAVELFKAAGFNIEGELKDKLYINGQYFNKYVMAKLLI